MVTKVIILLTVFITILIIYSTGIKIPCIFHMITGFYCPGCGITRCIIAILNFKFYQAFRYNPLILILLPFLTLYIIYKIYIWLFNKEDKITSKLTGCPIYCLIIVLIVYGILRNTNLFSWLAPTLIN